MRRGLPISKTLHRVPQRASSLCHSVILGGSLCHLTLPKREIHREQRVQHLIVRVFALFFCVSSVWCTSDAIARQTQAFVPGQSYFGRNQYIEYIAGNSPYIMSAPHGGSLTPSEIPDRTRGETVTDSNTRELARAVGAAVYAREGKYPHIIICHLKRTKLDANRDLSEALEGSNPYAIQAWKEFQSFIDTAKQTVIREYGKGFYVDIHGHGHEIQRLELGYLLSSFSLSLSDNSLNGGSYGTSSSIRTLIPTSGITFSQLLRGPNSFGSMFESRGFPAVPSATQPNPGSALYFSGGYNTARHGSSAGGQISGVQIECNYINVRDTETSYKRFAGVFAEAIDYYTALHLFHKPTVFVANESGVPKESGLMQNYPNPFNPRTAISFQLPAPSGVEGSAISFVRLKVFDALGREVATLVDEEKPAGSYIVTWNAQNLPSGVYLCRIVAGNYTDSKKMLLMK